MNKKKKGGKSAEKIPLVFSRKNSEKSCLITLNKFTSTAFLKKYPEVGIFWGF